MNSPPSTPSRNNLSSRLRDYGSSGLLSDRNSYTSPIRHETSFNDADFSSVSELTNDILATVDEDLLRLDVDNVSVLYNNAADAYSNNNASIFARTSKEPPQSILTKKRLVFILTPALGFEFARMFTSLFMLVNLDTFFNQYQYLPLPISGLLGICVIQYCAWRLRILNSMISADSHERRSVLVKYFFAFQIVTIVFIALITGISWTILSLDMEVTVVSPNSTSYDPKVWMISVNHPPLTISIFLMIGYIFVTSLTWSGQYTLVAFMSYYDSNVSPQNSSSAILLWSAAGGVLAGFFGILDTVSNWCPHQNCYDHMTAHVAIFSSIALCLSLVCVIISACVIYLDNLLELWERIVIYRKTHFFIDPNHKEDDLNQSQQQTRPDKTAQEDFDECAALLEASGRSFSSSHFTGHSIGSQNTLLDSDNGAMSAETATTNIKLYAHQIPKPAPTLKRMLKRKEYLSVVILVLVLSCLSVSFLYYTPTYLGQTVFNDPDTIQNASTATVHSDNGKAVTVAGSMMSKDDVKGHGKNKSGGVKLSCAGTFVCNLVFLIVYWKRKWISNAIHLRFKPWTCPLLLLAMSVFTTTLIATDSGLAYVFTASIFGMVKLVEAQMLHTTARRVDRSWPPVDDVITSVPQAFIWSLVPLSMAISTLVITPPKLSTGNPHVPMVFVTIFSVILVVAFGISHVTVI